MKNQYAIALLILVAVIMSASTACLVPSKVERQASWATIQDSQWKLQWQNSIRTQEQRTFWDSKIDLDVTSRAAAWYSEAQETGLLVLATPHITIYGFSFNPFETKSDEWVLRELARQGGSVAQEKLDINFDPATVPLTFQESATVQTSLGIIMKGSRFLAQTPQGDGYVAILRGIHDKDVLVFATAAQSLEASRATDNVATLLRHPTAEPNMNVVQCRVFATREGLIGGTTANGHVIRADDRFAALPSRAVLASKGGHEYSVRITHNGKSVLAPIWDVGPWNTDDNYWDPPVRRQWKNLDQCMPEAQAAYEQGYNSGNDQFGRAVKNPAGIDLSEGAWNDLGMTDNDWVTVDFLWATP